LVTVVGDSQLVIDVMRLEAVCNNEQLFALFAQAHSQVDDLERLGCCVDFQHRRRAHNVEADALANKAMDTRVDSATFAPGFVEMRARLSDRSQRDADSEPDDNPAAGDTSAPAPLCVPRLLALPDRQALLDILVKVHEASRHLSQLPHPRAWPVHLTVKWMAACRAFTPVLAKANDSPDDLVRVQALLDLLELPSLVLGRSRGSASDPPPDDPIRAAARRRSRATKLAYQDRSDRAMQELLSNGCADHSQDTFDILRKMHPVGAAMTPHRPEGKQLHVTPKRAQVLLFGLAGSCKAAPDCFGWSAGLLFPIRGQQKRGRFIPFLHQVARLVATLANATASPCLAQILTTGNLIGLHKLNADDRKRTAPS